MSDAGKERFVGQTATCVPSQWLQLALSDSAVT
jgi:hypothetical protein